MIPIYDMIQKYIAMNPNIFHMPGHKMGSTVASYYKDMIKWDVTETPLTDDLHDAKGAILKAQKLAARAFGADETLFLINGSTCGIHAMLLATCKHKDKIIVGRDCHKSVFNILAHIGVRAKFVNPVYKRKFGICGGYLAKDIEDALDQNPDATVVVITSPNYYGICSPIQDIARIVHDRGKILVVDEAHGAHFNFCDRLPKSALFCGADMVVQSAHKTLPALTQTAYLHIKGDRVDKNKVKRILSMIETTSPSFIFMASLDIARYIMEEEGNIRLTKICDRIDKLKKETQKFAGIKILDDHESEKDKTRLVINTSELGISGYDMQKILATKYNIHVEMADAYNVVCIVTACDSIDGLDKLEFALGEIASKEVGRCSINMVPMPKDCPVVDLVDVGDLKRELVLMDDAVGATSYNMIVPYPPGVPLVIAGQIITKEHVVYLKDIYAKGAVINGVYEGRIEIVKK
ncbi:MAG: aminotransferase class V-fold PLP-dependent enzyme [Clostridiales bacterium]|nr:aminotransferase class V-fold PLP-dependent enzyme [Clostridiales bacterium]